MVSGTMIAAMAKVHVAQRQRQQPLVPPAGDDVGGGARQPDDEADRRRGAHRPADVVAQHAQQRHADSPAADPHHRREPARDHPEDRPDPSREVPRPVGPAAAAQDHVEADDEHHRREHPDHDQSRDQPAEERADQHPREERRPPELQQREVDRPLAVMPPGRADRGEDDGRQRGPDGDLHDLAAVHVGERQRHVERRHDDHPAADAEKPCQHPAEDAGRHRRPADGPQNPGIDGLDHSRPRLGPVRAPAQVWRPPAGASRRRRCALPRSAVVASCGEAHVTGGSAP